MFGIQPGELMIILVLALIVLGPTKLPEAMRSMARAYGQFKRMTDDVQRDISSALDVGAEEPAERRDFRPVDPPKDAVDPAAPADHADAGTSIPEPLGGSEEAPGDPDASDPRAAGEKAD